MSTIISVRNGTRDARAQDADSPDGVRRMKTWPTATSNDTKPPIPIIS